MNAFQLQLLIAIIEGIGIPTFLDLVLPVLEQNPQVLAQYRTAFLGAADGIYRAYGINPPAHN